MNSVEKAVAILVAFTPNNKPMGSSELSRALGLTTSTVNRILHILEALALIQQDPITKRFSLGKTAVDIGMAVIRSLSTELLTIARPICDKLRDAFGETVALELWSGDSTVQAYNAPSSNPVSVLLGLRSHGDKYPAHVAAGAKSILAFSPAELVDQVIKGKLQRFTPNTITEPGLFKEHLKEIRKTGIAVDNGEFHMEVRAIGAPIFNAHKEPVAGLVIAAPFYRANVLMQAATMERLKEAALAISTQLQYSGETEDRGNTPAV
jgi:DNA-binding IclR family transcriptional regulator